MPIFAGDFVDGLLKSEEDLPTSPLWLPSDSASSLGNPTSYWNYILVHIEVPESWSGFHLSRAILRGVERFRIVVEGLSGC